MLVNFQISQDFSWYLDIKILLILRNQQFGNILTDSEKKDL
ncbi:hypothetical protein SAMN05421690_102217 [Nitrosomonas sp. Nm51]|nr:hypothetical protein SAMN05421690_102217 [Nitrosomonas sp. Nm51]